jgi:predicted dehydrogenase
MNRIGIIGTGFVADLYMRSLATFPQIEVTGAYDINDARLSKFCSHWKIRAAKDLRDILDDGANSADLILNLTNPSAHFEVTRACLEAGKHVYSEKPLAMNMNEARALYALAKSNSLLLASAPCSLLGEAAQTAWCAIRRNTVGKVRLIYAALDDDFIIQAPYLRWSSESGAPWPYRDEFSVGCTLEHAGYYLTWLIAMFGSVEKVVAASAEIIPGKIDGVKTAPDFSCATLFFSSGAIARLTCSIIAPHDHTLRIIGDTGVLEVDKSWDNSVAVRVRRRHIIRRRLINSPLATRIKLRGPTHPKVGRWGAAAMNFALGPAEMLSALREARPCRLSADFALHLNEVTLAIQNANGSQQIETRCAPIEPMPWASN